MTSFVIARTLSRFHILALSTAAHNFRNAKQTNKSKQKQTSENNIRHNKLRKGIYFNFQFAGAHYNDYLSLWLSVYTMWWTLSIRLANETEATK